MGSFGDFQGRKLDIDINLRLQGRYEVEDQEKFD